MANYEDISDEVRDMGSPLNLVRKRCMENIHKLTGRNVLSYYSDCYFKSNSEKSHCLLNIGFNDDDKNCVQEVIQRLDQNKGLDIILHMPHEGMDSEIDVIDSIINYLFHKFDGNIRVMIPQIISSTGTIISLSCKEILMGNYSSLGPIDPKVGGMSSNGILEEIDRAYIETRVSPELNSLWKPIISKYDSNLIDRCQNCIIKAQKITKSHLMMNMLAVDSDKEDKANRILEGLTDFPLRKSHNIHLPLKYAKKIGIKVIDLNDIYDLQNALLETHSLYIQTLANTSAFKIIETHEGMSFFQNV